MRSDCTSRCCTALRYSLSLCLSLEQRLQINTKSYVLPVLFMMDDGGLVSERNLPLAALHYLLIDWVVGVALFE